MMIGYKAKGTQQRSPKKGDGPVDPVRAAALTRAAKQAWATRRAKWAAEAAEAAKANKKKR